MRAEFNQDKLDKIEKEEKGIPEEGIELKDVDSLVAYLDSCWEEAKSAKENHAEPQVLSNMRQIDGEYDAAKIAAIKEIGGSEVFMMITDAKCKNAANWVDELLFQPNQKPWDISPTPVPELPEYALEEFYSQAVPEIISSLEMEAQATGVKPNIEMVRERLNQIMPQIKEMAPNFIFEQAKKLAEKVSQEVDDKLTEGGWYSALKQCIPNIVMHTGFITGPIPKKRPSIKIKPLPNGKLVSHIVNDVIPTWESRHPLNIYPAPDATNLNDGYLFDRIKLTPIALQELISVPSYDEDEIRAVLEEAEGGKLYEWLSVDQEKSDVDDTPSPLSYDSEKIDCLKFMGAVKGKAIKEWGKDKGPDDKKIDEDFYYNIIAYKISSHVISVQYNKDPLGRKPYYKTSFEEVDGSFWGKGLPQVIKDVQSVCNAMARAIVNNAGIGSGPQVERNTDRIPAAARSDNKLIPWKVWDVTGDAMASPAPALKFYQPPMVVERLMSVYTAFSKIADEHSGVPAFAHGDPNVGGAGSTASGLSMLMGSAARGIKAIIKSIDEYIIKPSVERQYSWMIDRADYYGMVCDYQIVSGGTLAALAREQMAARRIEFMNSTANPVDAQIMGMEGRKYVINETAKSVNMDLSRIMPKQSSQQPAPLQLPAPGPGGGGQPNFGPTGENARTLDLAGAPVVGQDTRSFNIPGRASGGPVEANKPYIVGEGGKPEIFVPEQDGMVIPNDQFDPEGSGYDIQTAQKFIDQYSLTMPKPSKYEGDYLRNDGAYQAWVWHPELNDYKKHSASLDPTTGMVLKGRQSSTWDMTEETEKNMGSMIVQGEDGRYYAVPQPIGGRETVVPGRTTVIPDIDLMQWKRGQPGSRNFKGEGRYKDKFRYNRPGQAPLRYTRPPIDTEIRTFIPDPEQIGDYDIEIRPEEWQDMQDTKERWRRSVKL